jgi:hypothetical protein
MALYAELSKLQFPRLAQGVAETIVYQDRFLGLLPFVDVSPAIQYTWNKEASLGFNNTGSFIDQMGTYSPESASYTNTVQNFSTIVAGFDLPDDLATSIAVSTEVGKKSKIIANGIGKAVVSGRSTDANTNFTGLRYTVSGSSTQDIAVATVGSGSLTLGKLDELLSLVKVGRPNIIVTSPAGLRYFKGQIRSSGTTAESLQVANYGAPFVSYDSIPIVTTDWIGTEENGGTSFYALYANEIDGVTLWSNIMQMIALGSPVRVPYSVKSNYTVKASFGFVVPTPLVVARLYGVTG